MISAAPHPPPSVDRAPESHEGPFAHGVASFEPTSSGVLLWTRVDAPGPVRWELAVDADFAHVVAGGTAAPTGDGGSRVVTVDGLRPATDHHYRFWLGSQASPVGRTRTLPADDRPVRIGLACCGDYSAGHFASYRALAETDVDVVVHLGDYVYAEVEGDLRPVTPDHDAVTRADYRARYDQVRRDPDLQALHQRHPVLTVIDDHDLADNAHRDGAKTHDPDEHGPWSVRRAAAVAERGEWLPIRTDGPPEREDPAQWRSVRLGTLGELVLLDTRLAGRDAPADDDDTPDLDDEERTILGRPQMRWARERIVDPTPGPWSVVVSSVVVNPMRLDLPGRFRLNGPFPSGYLIEDGHALNTDGWDGYPADRRRLTDAFRARGRGGVLLSGDVHSAWAFEGPADDTGPAAVEFTCPAVTSEPMGEMVPVVGRALERLEEADHGVAWADLFARGHLIVEVTPEAVTGTWFFTDPGALEVAPDQGPSWTTRLDEPGKLRRLDDHEVVPAPSRAAAAAPVPGRPESLAAAHAARRRRRRRRRTTLVAGLLGAAWALGRRTAR